MSLILARIITHGNTVTDGQGMDDLREGRLGH